MSSSKTSKKPARISFASITPGNIGTLRKINGVVFPIKYSEKFYQDVLLPELEDFCKLVYYNDVPVGTICCKMETKDEQTNLYLMTMGVLAPYRGRKLGSESLELIFAAASAKKEPTISHVYLHVQVSNADGRRFYERHGFKEVGLHENYYKKILPRDAWILRREIQSAQLS
ncbi:acyl-CoA N-acyltransferase [Athelia psychrophila]|uniref:Acyl-CoA N-acyltransferase n=1 Tax=Athelia psychrophila TaxID=1759441 RepID=A0A166XF66_9AGAM|nr:acyl-CoA N-acyltransferase [Fibularhizoctonia sp. CBS 109695]